MMRIEKEEGNKQTNKKTKNINNGKKLPKRLE